MPGQPAGVVHRAAAALANRLGGRGARWRTTISPWFSGLLHVLSAGRGVPMELNGEPFRIDPRCRVFLQPDYEADLASFLRARIRKGATCLDIGAHIGAYALQMGRWVGPAGRVIAFEPNPGTAAILRRHLRLNGLDAIVAVEGTALGRDEGTATLFGDAGSGFSRLGAPNPDVPLATGAARVPVTTVDRYCAANDLSPDWMLVDVEGYEFDVLEWARVLLGRRAAALSVVVEVHPGLWSSAGWSRADAEALLASLGRQPVALTGQGDPLGDYGAVLLAWSCNALPRHSGFSALATASSSVRALRRGV